MEKLWSMKKKKGGADILTNMLLSVDGGSTKHKKKSLVGASRVHFHTDKPPKH